MPSTIPLNAARGRKAAAFPFSGAELRSIVDSLDPRGLFLNIMVQDRAGMDVLRPIVGM